MIEGCQECIDNDINQCPSCYEYFCNFHWYCDDDLDPEDQIWECPTFDCDYEEYHLGLEEQRIDKLFAKMHRETEQKGSLRYFQSSNDF